MLYKIFCSPTVTKEARAAGDDKVNLLLGNIFAERGMSLPMDIYRSLLQTLAVRPKKKHFKKIVAYIREHEPIERVSPQLLDQLVNIGIN